MRIRLVIVIFGLALLGVLFAEIKAYSQSPDRIVEQSCNTNADCTGGRICVSNWCAECGNDSDCSGSNRKFCLANSQYPKLNRCVECINNVQCAGEGMICEATRHTCTCTGGKILVSTKSFPTCSECAGYGTHQRCTNLKSCPLGMLCATPVEAPQERTGYCIPDCRKPKRFEMQELLPKSGKGSKSLPGNQQNVPESKYIAPDLPKQNSETVQPVQ